MIESEKTNSKMREKHDGHYVSLGWKSVNMKAETEGYSGKYWPEWIYPANL